MQDNTNEVLKQSRVKINTQSLVNLAIYLAGFKDGKGNLLPLGTIDLDELWAAISYLRGDVRYAAERDESIKS